jgi:hypothetical protein
MTARLRVGAACVVVAAVASTLAACGGDDEVATPTASPTVARLPTSVATQTPSAAEYERAIGDWYVLCITADVEVIRIFQETLPSDPGQANVFFGEVLAKVHELEDAMERLPPLQAPAGYTRFDTELRRVIGMKRDGAEMLIEAAEPIDPRKWSTGVTLLEDGRRAELDVWCLLPKSSSLRERYCLGASLGY